MKLSELFLDRYLYRDNNQEPGTKGSVFNSLDNSDTEPASIPSGGAAQDINTGNVPLDPAVIPSTTLDIANWGWGQDCVFTSDDLETVSWGGGDFTSASGDVYAIDAGTTGAMSDKTYIYLSLLDSETEYQFTTVSGDSVGLGKVLIAVAENAAVEVPQPDATFNLQEASQVVADNILANTINATKMNVAVLSAITVDAGTLTAGTITGLTVRTASSGTRVQMTGADARLDVYSGATRRMSLDADSLEFYNPSGTLTSTLTADASFGFLLDGSYSAFENVIRYNGTYGMFMQAGGTSIAKFYSGGLAMWNGSNLLTYDIIPQAAANTCGDSGNPFGSMTADELVANDGITLGVDRITDWSDVGGGANTSLSNLSSVAVNTSIVPSSTYGLGTSSNRWGTVYSGASNVSGNATVSGSLLITNGPTLSSSGIDMNGDDITEVDRIGGTSGQIDFSSSGIDMQDPIFMEGGNLNMEGYDIAGVDQVQGNSGNIDFNISGRVQVSTNFDPSDAGGDNLGGSTRWWGFLNVEDITKQGGGGFGWFDTGVTLQDGTIVSDIEALVQMQPHPTKKTKYGKPIIDMTTIPEEVMVLPKSIDGTLIKKNQDGKYFETVVEKEIEKVIEHSEGENVFAMMSIMIGAIKELSAEINLLKAENVAKRII